MVTLDVFKNVRKRTDQLIQFSKTKLRRTNYELFPLTVLVTFALSLGVVTAIRLLAKSPDVLIDKRGHHRSVLDTYEHMDPNKLPSKLYSPHVDPRNMEPDPDRPKL